jgi:hypothetical protein
VVCIEAGVPYGGFGSNYRQLEGTNTFNAVRSLHFGSFVISRSGTQSGLQPSLVLFLLFGPDSKLYFNKTKFSTLSLRIFNRGESFKMLFWRL